MNLLKKSLIAPSVALLLSSSYAAEELESITVVGQQDSYYDEYNSTSMKGEVADNETPFSTTVTNKTLINDIQALRIEDTYDYTTGVTKSGSKADGITIRGFDIDLENLQVDGMPGLTTRYGSPSTANVEKVEVLKGVAGVLYGGVEAGGVVNIQTKQPQAEDKIIVETSYSTYISDVSKVGVDNSFTTSLDATGTIKDDLFYRFIAIAESLESYIDKVEYHNIHLYPSLLWDKSDQTSLLFAFEYGKENGTANDGLAVVNNNISTAASINTTYQENGDYDNDKGSAFDMKFEHNLVDGSIFNVSWRSVFHTDERKLYENRSVDDDTKTLKRRYRHQRNERQWHTIDSNYVFKTNTADITHNITAGVALNYRLTDLDRLGFGKNLKGIDIYNPIYGESSFAGPNTKLRAKYMNKALYLQDKVDINDELILVASARVERTDIDFDAIRGASTSYIDNSSSSNNIASSLGLVYNLNHLVTLYTNVSQGYVPTSAQRVDLNSNNLDSEKFKQIELGAKFNINEKLNTSFSIYKINKENVAEKISDNMYELIGEVESEGFEVDIQWIPTPNWQIKAGYAYNDAQNISGDSQYSVVKNNPENTAFIFTRYNHQKKVLNGTVGISTGISYKDIIYTTSKKSTTVELPSYIKADIGMYYDAKDWGLSLNIENITNELYYEYGDSNSIYSGAPRKITLNYKTTF